MNRVPSPHARAPATDCRAAVGIKSAWNVRSTDEFASAIMRGLRGQQSIAALMRQGEPPVRGESGTGTPEGSPRRLV